MPLCFARCLITQSSDMRSVSVERDRYLKDNFMLEAGEDLRWYSFVVVELEIPENAEREDMWDVNELTLEGSPPTFELPLMFDDAFVLRANG